MTQLPTHLFSLRTFPYVFWRTRSTVNTYSSMNVAFIFWADMQPKDSAPQDSAYTFQVEAAPLHVHPCVWEVIAEASLFLPGL